MGAQKEGWRLPENEALSGRSECALRKWATVLCFSGASYIFIEVIEAESVQTVLTLKMPEPPTLFQYLALDIATPAKWNASDAAALGIIYLVTPIMGIPPITAQEYNSSLSEDLCDLCIGESLSSAKRSSQIW